MILSFRRPLQQLRYLADTVLGLDTSYLLDIKKYIVTYSNIIIVILTIAAMLRNCQIKLYSELKKPTQCTD